jgi:hypothetical protein
MEPAGQDSEVLIAARNGHSTAPFGKESQSFPDNLPADFGAKGSANDPTDKPGYDLERFHAGAPQATAAVGRCYQRAGHVFRVSEAFLISKGDRDAIAERIQEIIFAFVVLVSDPEIFDLLDKMIPSLSFVDNGLVERMVCVLDLSPMDVSGDRNRAFVLARRGQFRFDGTSRPLASQRLLQQNCPGILVLDPCAE